MNQDAERPRGLMERIRGNTLDRVVGVETGELTDIRPSLTVAMGAVDRDESAARKAAEQFDMTEMPAVEQIAALAHQIAVERYNQRRADAINAVARAKAHGESATPVFRAYDAAAAWDIAEILNGVAGAPPTKLPEAFGEKPVASPPVSRERAIAVAGSGIAPDEGRPATGEQEELS